MQAVADKGPGVRDGSKGNERSTMSAAVATEAVSTSYGLCITREFDAPRELVWKAWTDPEMGMQWMGPRGFRATEFVTPAEPGGRWRLVMEGCRPGSSDLVRLGQGGVTLEIKPPELLVYTFAWDERSAVGLEESPQKENIVTIRFEERGKKTLMHFHQTPFATEGERDGHTGGWNSVFDRFAEFMLAEQPGRQLAADEAPSELHLKRSFRAPLQLVFDAWTKPQMLTQWWGPERFDNPRCEVDARGGGAIVIDMRGPDGTVYPMVGRFVEIYPPHRLHFTSSLLDAEGNRIFETWTSVFFEEVEGGTEVTLDVHVTSTTPEAPRYLKGMNAGWNQSLDKLARIVQQAS